MKTYLQGLNYTDQATQKFIEEIDKIENQLQLFGMEIIYQVSIRNKI